MSIESQLLQNSILQLNLAEGDEYLVLKFLTFIDIEKIKGNTRIAAAANFANYLKMVAGLDSKKLLMLMADGNWIDTVSSWFHHRWDDHYVHIKVPQDMLKFISGEIPIFTPFRLEEYAEAMQGNHYCKYLQGGAFHRTNGNPMRVDLNKDAQYSYFIIREGIPEHFYIQIPTDEVADALTRGIKSTTVENDAFQIFKHPSDVKTSVLSTDRQYENKKQQAVCKIDADMLDITVDSLFTRKMSGSRHMGGTHAVGIFFRGEIPNKAIKVLHTTSGHVHKPNQNK